MARNLYAQFGQQWEEEWDDGIRISQIRLLNGDACQWQPKSHLCKCEKKGVCVCGLMVLLIHSIAAVALPESLGTFDMTEINNVVQGLKTASEM
jgi:hypothetical protein